jgi:hypothetical protein
MYNFIQQDGCDRSVILFVVGPSISSRGEKKQCRIWFYNSGNAQMHLQNRIVFCDLVHVASCREGSFGNIQLSAGTNHFAYLQARNFESCKIRTAYTSLQLVFQAFIGRKSKAI